MIFILYIKIASNYSEKHEEKIRKILFQNLSEEEKEKKCQYQRECNKNISLEQKQKSVDIWQSII